MSEVSLQGAEKVEFSETPTAGDIATFQDEEQRELDFKEFMLGEQHQTGGRHDLDSRGLSTDNVQVREEAILQPYEPDPLPIEPDYVQSPTPQPPTASQETDWQREYGRSENEKGELRRQLQQAMNRAHEAEQVVATANVQVPTFFDNQPAPPQPVAAPTVQPPVFDPNQLPRMVEKPDGEPMFAEDVDKLMKTQVIPYVFTLQQQLEQAQQTAYQANQRMFEVEKSRLGITPQEERVMVAQNPWLQGMRDPSAYIQALGQIKAREAAAAAAPTPPPAPAAPAQPATQPQRVEVRRRTFVESGSQAAGPAQPDARSLDPNRLFAQEWAKTMDLPYQERAEAQRKLLKSRGARTVSGYRDPSVLTG